MIRFLKPRMMGRMGITTCEQIEQIAYENLEGQLDMVLQAKFEQHLRGCGNCEPFVRSYTQVARPDRIIGTIELDPDFERRLARFLEENR